MKAWAAGLVFAVVIGGIVTALFLAFLRRTMAPPATAGKDIPNWITGAVERVFFTVLVGLEVSGTPTAMIGWLAVKMASNWNHPDWKKKPDARAFAVSALLAGLVSMLFAAIGGLICANKISLGI